MLHLTDANIDRIIARRMGLVCLGFALMALPWALPPGWGLGLFSGFVLVSLGLYGFMFRNWRTEPGLWMLAILLTALLGPAWGAFEVAHWRAILARPAGRPIDWGELRVSIDAAIGLVLLAHTLTFVATVAAENWRRTRRPSGPIA